MSAHKYLSGSFVCLMLCLATITFADTTNGQHGKLIRQLSALAGFTAEFNQQVFNDTHDLIENSNGSMTFQRPGKFRWIYHEPYEQRIISDGVTLWIYDVDLEQVSKRPVGEGLNQTPIRLLDNPESIQQDFDIESLSDTEFETIVRLTPKHNEAGFKSVVLTFTNGDLSVMRIHDNFDQTSLLSFRDVNTSPDIQDSDFQFEAPEGVDVLDATRQPD